MTTFEKVREVICNQLGKPEEKVTLDKELAKKWLSNGAQPTDTVKALLKNEGILKEFASSKKGK